MLNSILEKFLEIKELGFLVVLALVYFLGFHRNTQFLANCLYPGRGVIGYVRAFGRALTIVGVSLKSFSGRDAFSTKSSRLLVEIEILNPSPEKPVKSDFVGNESKYREEMRAWESATDKRRAFIRASLASLLKKMGRPDENPEIRFNLLKNSIDDCRAAIKRYFMELKKTKEIDNTSEFISDVLFVGGYVGPQFLVHGILSRFRDDWNVVIENYKSQVAEIRPYARDLVEVRSFQFSCWLLWGPSIPICQCKQWHGNRPPHFTKSGTSFPVAYQFGYGDEDNSVDLLDFKFSSAEHREMMSIMMNPPPETTGGSSHVRAAPCKLVARISWGPNYPENTVCKAQKMIQDPVDGRVALSCVSLDESVEPDSAPYFSAYIWIMFLIVDEDGKPFFEKESWHNLVPFFEHGNIADASTYYTLKKLLVAKVIAGIKTFIEGDMRVSLRIACASDQSLCKHPKGVLFQPPEQELLIELLRAQFDKDPDLKEYVDRKRFAFPVDAEKRSATELQYASCYLPDCIESFLKQLHPVE